MNRPEVHYALAGEDYVAYQVVGAGPVDIVFQGGWTTHADIQWDVPEVARFLEGLASFSRLIVFDRRGHGMSDPVDLDNVTLESWMEDTAAVMDACSSERAVLIGPFESGPAQILHSATHPARTAGLVLINTWACGTRSDDYPWGFPPHAVDRNAEIMRKFFLGEDDSTFGGIAPDLASDDRARELMRRLLRASTSPGRAERLVRFCWAMDVRHVLPSCRSPTLILHNVDQPICRVEHGRYLAEHIADAKYVELPGSAMYPWWGDQDAVLAEIEEFVTGVRPVREPDRVLTTVLFTDIVGSTERAVRIGDRKWREVLERIDGLIRTELAQSRGLFVKDTGDGFLATFDGPARAVRCAMSVVDVAKAIDVDLRVGLHTGEVELAGDDVRGIAVHIGARVAALASSGEVLVSRTVTDLVAGSGLSFTERGSHVLKGVPGEMQLYAVER
jgi:class 3 adenylate cyclase/pimeloyl-ACP methyl ester carboxylesterase